MIVYSENDKYQAEFSFDDGVPPDNDLGDFSGQQFSTYDQDNDQSDDKCAKKCGGGFWYNNCDEGNNKGTINQHSSSGCGGFKWDKYQEGQWENTEGIMLKETKLYLSCN